MPVSIALVGNPNSGKTTVFNKLTGSAQYVGNWPGVTVGKKEGPLKGDGNVIITDLPGIYSLSPYSLEEGITRDFLTDEKPDVILNIIDATNLERSLYLTSQVLEMGIPTVIALNMVDELGAAGASADAKKLARELGCPVTETCATKGIGIEKASAEAVKAAKSGKARHGICAFSRNIEEALLQISMYIESAGDPYHDRRQAIKAFERDPKAMGGIRVRDREAVERIVGEYEKLFDDDGESIIAGERYKAAERIMGRAGAVRSASKMKLSNKIDAVATNRVLAIPIFFLVMWGMYYLSIQIVGGHTAGFMRYIFNDLIGARIGNFLIDTGAARWLVSLVTDGILSGVGAVLSFVPQLMALFFCVSVFEDCGYMSRVAFIMDRIFKQFGLSGKSFIPMIVGAGCSVPGIMASRTIENEQDRRMTIMLTPFVPCGAKLPVFALFAATFFPGSSFAAPSMYFLGIAMIIISGMLLKRTSLFKKTDPAPFLMELPSYRMPRLRNIWLQVWSRSKAYIIKAGTVIFLASAVLWFLQSFNWRMQTVEPGQSMLASIGRAVAPVFAPLGFGKWEAAVALLSGTVAKETVIAAFSVLLPSGLSGFMSAPAAYAFMAFVLLSAPCVAAVAAIKREMGSIKWTLIATGYQTGLAYIVAMLIFQVGRLIV